MEEKDLNLVEVNESNIDAHSVGSETLVEKINELTETDEKTEEEIKDITEEEIKNMSPEERRELVLALKRMSQPRFFSRKHVGNKTVNKFDSKYKEKRRKRNKTVKQSRKANRK